MISAFQVWRTEGSELVAFSRYSKAIHVVTVFQLRHPMEASVAILPKRMPILLGLWLAATLPAGAAFATETYAVSQFNVDQAVYAASFSPTGDRIAFATDAGTIILDTSDGKQMAEVKDEASSVAWSPDGSMLMVETRNQLQIWNTADFSKEISAIPLDGQSLIREAPRMPFSPDGRYIVVLRKDDTAAVWQIEGPREISILDGHTDTMTDASFSPDGGRVVTAAHDKTARVWDVATGKEIAKLEGHEKAVSSARFSPDGARILTVARDQTARVWEAAGGHEIATLRHQADVGAAAFDREGKRIVTGADDGIARVFDAASGAETATLKEDGIEKVLSAAFSPDGARIATGSSDAYVRIWDASLGKQIVKLNSLSEGYGVGFTDDARIVVRPHGAMGIIYTLQPQQDATQLADGTAGMWAFGPPDDVDATPDVMHLMCSTSPYIVHPDGLVEYLVGGEDERLEPRQFMRCKADMTCDVFEGAPHSLAADPLDKATFKLAGGKGTLCMASDPGNCQTLRKCAKLEWDDAARASGHAEQWEKLFAASAN
ncbi:WD40 repeat domain-containing protein [Mesorhizobium sp. M2C.T.Ca.TU.002.02.1.1]|uniref:WD40 repeat domain-containing protein n=1 Tax=Mesorhizobium sp. M2C.T.Ca.TU.002.02.1.1 TaxID=2496788 RepID=UPI000FC9D4C9|nr:WD40 repeat domain-containing protein [Mesorhizobium sp. M2C.T.Ca.TU.002.02.1.1]RUU60963.1 WD40 repeat domain-containing protein [Mesorhizobium sp. M2C.T.Ca.TU.002.02.1.1]RUU70437.1 WD40 repeat domain-containing protein [Mesorhizobium sp. M2C.T.Ca.TU.009.01.2.1]